MSVLSFMEADTEVVLIYDHRVDPFRIIGALVDLGITSAESRAICNEVKELGSAPCCLDSKETCTGFASELISRGIPCDVRTL